MKIFRNRIDIPLDLGICYFSRFKVNSIKYFLQTERLGFRKWREDDLDLAVGLWGDFEVTKLFDSRIELSKEQIQKRLFQEIVTEQKQRVQYWPIFLLENGNHVGACGLRPYQANC